MICGITGLPGAGKTLYAVSQMLKARASGRDVVANFHSRTNKWDYALWEDMKERANALVVMDEAQMWFGSRAWTATKQDELSFFQQSRKQGLDLVWIAQHEARVDTAMRELTAFYSRCRGLFRGGLIWVRKCTPEEPKKSVGSCFFRPGKHLFGHYWTEEVIGLRASTETVFGKTARHGRGSEATDGQPRLWPAEDGALRVAPNLWRVIYPYDHVATLTDYRALPRHVSDAIEAWRRATGHVSEWQVLVSAFYRDTYGMVHAVDEDSVIHANGEADTPPTWLHAELDKISRRVNRLPDGQGVRSAGAAAGGVLADVIAATGYRRTA